MVFVMDQNALLIAEAILHIRQGSDVFKDYVFPISTAFFSAFAGGVSAYYFNRRQDRGKDEKENFKTANRIFLIMLSAQSALKALKINYYHIRETHPIKRALIIPPMDYNEKKIDFDISSLSFIKDIPTSNKGFIEKLQDYINYNIFKVKVERPSPQELEVSWRNLKRLNTCIANYNVLIDLLKSRAVLDKELRGELRGLIYGDVEDVIFERIKNSIDSIRLQNYLYETEILLVMVDHIIIEIESFSKQFSKIAESNIELSFVGKGASLMRALMNEQENQLVLSKIVQVDYSLFSKYTKIPLDKIPELLTFYGGD